MSGCDGRGESPRFSSLGRDAEDEADGARTEGARCLQEVGVMEMFPDGGRGRGPVQKAVLSPELRLQKHAGAARENHRLFAELEAPRSHVA